MNYPRISASTKSFSVGGAGSLNEKGDARGNNSSLLTMREYDETMRDLRKENFNLKLRIYFLEERLGTSRVAAVAGSKEELVQANIDLKVNIESLKYDNKEKTELLAEASQAIESLESRLAVMAVEREDERTQLEEKLRQLEEDFSDQQLYGIDKEANYFPLDITPIPQRRQSGEALPPDDESLLVEVDAEMARGVVVPPKISSSQQTTPTPFPGGQAQCLEVVEEKDEVMVGRLEDLEDNVERLNAIIKATEICLQQVKNVVL